MCGWEKLLSEYSDKNLSTLVVLLAKFRNCKHRENRDNNKNSKNKNKNPKNWELWDLEFYLWYGILICQDVFRDLV